MKYTIFWLNFNDNLNFINRFPKKNHSIPNFMKIRLVGGKSLHADLSAVGLVVYTTRPTSREVYMTTAKIEDTATYPSKIVTKQQGRKQHCTRNIP